MPIIHVHMLEGRPAAQKNDLARRLTQSAVEALRVKEEAVRVILHEISPQHWYVQGQPKEPAAD